MKVVAQLRVRGIGSTLKRKNAYPIIGVPMLERFLTEMKKAKFIDHIFVWTEDDELADITRQCRCHVVPRSLEQVFEYSGFGNPQQWGEEVSKFIADTIGGETDIHVWLNCNYCLFTAELLEEMFCKLLEDQVAETIVPVVKVDPHLFMENPKTGYLFPVWHHETLDRQEYPDLFRFAGISITHLRRYKGSAARRLLYHEVAPEYLLDVDSEEDVKLAEYYLMRRLGGRIVLPEQNEAKPYAVPRLHSA